MTLPSDDLDLRRRRAAYRAHHRGTKEMDWLMGKFADARLAAMDGAALARFEELIALPDPELQKWILEGLDIKGSDLADLVGELRRFHGIGGTT